MPLLDTDISKAKKMFDVNIWGLLAVTQQFSPLLIASKGTLLNVASIAAYTWVCLKSYSLHISRAVCMEQNADLDCIPEPL